MDCQGEKRKRKGTQDETELEEQTGTQEPHREPLHVDRTVKKKKRNTVQKKPEHRRGRNRKRKEEDDE
jgi:hypothetical protein